MARRESLELPKPRIKAWCVYLFHHRRIVLEMVRGLYQLSNQGSSIVQGAGIIIIEECPLFIWSTP